MREIEVGTWAEIPSPYVTNIMAKAGLNFSIIDMEHGVIDFEMAQNMIFAAHSEKKKIYVRVPVIKEEWILRVLDMGCDGIIFPQVVRKEDVEKIIEYSCFPPIGKRGFNPYITAGGYAPVQKDYFQDENDRIQIGIILEGADVFDNIDEILQYDEIDVIYIGQYDLSMALGVPGQVNHPKVMDFMLKTVEKIEKLGKKAGCMVHSADEAKKMIEKGFSFIVYKVDSGILFECIQKFCREVCISEAI